MIGVGKYPGDEKTEELLRRYRPTLSFAEIRAAVAGAVLTVEMVQPSQLMDHLFGSGNEGLAFEDAATAQDWFSCLMGLWNRLTEHQNIKKPFLFSEWPMQISGGNDELLRLSRSREKEIEQFLWGFEQGIRRSLTLSLIRHPRRSSLGFRR